MKIRFPFILLLLIFILGCVPATVTPTVTPAPSATPQPTALIHTTPVPDARMAVQNWLDAWGKEDYGAMYDLLTQVSQTDLTREKFVARFTEVATQLTLQKLSAEVLQSGVLNPRLAQAAYRVTFQTALVGQLQREIALNLAMEDGAWKVEWNDGLIMPELKGGNRLKIEITAPQRGSIYDFSGKPIAAESDAYALGAIPGRIQDGRKTQICTEVAALTGQPATWLKTLIDNAGAGDYVPLGEAPKAAVDARMKVLTSLSGLVVTPFSGHYYYDGGASHAVGYVQSIYKADAPEYQRLGYNINEKIGKSGLEEWGQKLLAGQRGATLYLMDPKGEQKLGQLGQSDSKPAQSIYTTLDLSLQAAAQKALAGFKGAIVVLERNTGRVLVMASSPGIDPNAFNTDNLNWVQLINGLNNSPDNPYFNRATQATYPLGSIFKTVTMAAALESGVYTPETVYDCQYEFNELQGVTLYDWTKEKEVKPSGKLTLPEGLMRSCNTYFYHIGLDLYRQKGDKPVTDMARSFGLGALTGIGPVAEYTGSMPYPINEYEAVQIAFGQGAMLATPLQVANLMAAIGNGGTLYRPQLVEKIVAADGTVSFSFKPEVKNQVAVSQANLTVVQDAMSAVVKNKRGTAYSIFAGLDLDIRAKTGTATNSLQTSHAWFAGYTNANWPDKPDIAIAVLCENAGEGSEVSAPIFRRVVENYFYGKPSTLYPWESNFYVNRKK
jgi:penicillin-binding protein 2